MSRRHLLCAAAAFFGFALPAAAGVTVVGAGNARMCFLAAESDNIPDLRTIDRCDDAIEEERGNGRRLVATHVNRGILRLRRGDRAGALADFDRATALDPDEPEAYLNRGSMLLNNDETARAIVQFDNAIARNTRRPALAYYGRGVAYEESGNVRAAYRDYLRARDLAPTWAEPRTELTRFRLVSN